MKSKKEEFILKVTQYQREIASLTSQIIEHCYLFDDPKADESMMSISVKGSLDMIKQKTEALMEKADEYCVKSVSKFEEE